MEHLNSLLFDLKAYRQQFAERLAYEMDQETVCQLAETHTAILAVEAVMAEPESRKICPKIEIGPDGYQK
jgi:hypothetical protein